jgi:hypothetical protein
MAVVEPAARQQSPAHRRLADGGGRGTGCVVCVLTASSWQRRGKYETTPTENLCRWEGGRREQRAALLLQRKQKQTNESSKAENVLEKNSTTK